MGSYIPPLLQGSIGGVEVALAGVYESRTHTVARMLVPRAQYAGDTAITLTDGSFNNRLATTPATVPQSATAYLANVSNTINTGLNPAGYGKPLVVKMKRNSASSEIGILENEDPALSTSPVILKDYAVFNADGTWPGGLNPWNFTAGTGARYRVNTATGEIYVNNAQNLIEHNNPDGIVNFSGNTYSSFTAPPAGPLATDSGMQQQVIGGGDEGTMEGSGWVVGMVSFDSLQGGALATAQQQASELSGVIQSLTSIIRSINDGKRNILNIIK